MSVVETRSSGPAVNAPSVRSRAKVRYKAARFVAATTALAIFLGATLFVWLRPLDVLDACTRLRLYSWGMSSEYTVIGGNRIHNFAGGHGDPVLLVHGLGSKSEDWSEMISVLVKSGYRVYAIDLLGYGRSDHPREASYSIAQQSELVEQFIADRHLQRVELMGWSMGGWIAAKVAVERPELVDRLVLMDSAGTTFQVNFNRSIFLPRTTRDLEALYALILPRPVHMPLFITRHLLDRMQRQSWVVERNIQSMMSGADLLDRSLGQLKMPVLVVWGKQDHLLPLSNGERIHRQIPQSVLEVFDGCGHLAPAQCANSIGPHTVEFLRAKPAIGPAVRDFNVAPEWQDRLMFAAQADRF